MRSLPCARLRSARWRRICRCSRVWIASGCRTRGLEGGVETSLAAVLVIFGLEYGVGEDLVGGLDGLEARDAFCLFAGVAVGMILEGELAVGLANVVDGGGGGEF